jgi:hypothetical protein
LLVVSLISCVEVLSVAQSQDRSFDWTGLLGLVIVAASASALATIAVFLALSIRPPGVHSQSSLVKHYVSITSRHDPAQPIRILAGDLDFLGRIPLKSVQELTGQMRVCQSFDPRCVTDCAYRSGILRRKRHQDGIRTVCDQCPSENRQYRQLAGILIDHPSARIDMVCSREEDLSVADRENRRLLIGMLTKHFPNQIHVRVLPKSYQDSGLRGRIIFDQKQRTEALYYNVRINPERERFVVPHPVQTQDEFGRYVIMTWRLLWEACDRIDKAALVELQNEYAALV